MSIKDSRYKIILLNQVTGPLFRELSEDFAKDLGATLLVTGRQDTEFSPGNNTLTVITGAGYDRRSNAKRLISWLRYFFKALSVTWKCHSRPLLFIVSNPPFLGLIGFLFKIVRNQKYVVLVYDIYPDVLLRIGTLSNGLIARFWRFINRLILQHADIVFTISRDMADCLEQNYDLDGTAAESVVVIPNWADIETIKPMVKSENWFAVRHQQVDKVTVLYSGNMGNTHDVESILAVARRLRENDGIHFLFIGEGIKSALVRRARNEEGLENITYLPLQAEDVLPYSLTTGDIGIVSYQSGTEGCLVPSKVYTYMAAGLAPLVICGAENDLSRTILENSCGVVVTNGIIDDIVEAVQRLSRDYALLAEMKQRSRLMAVQYFSRNNTRQYIEAIKSFNGDRNSISSPHSEINRKK